MTSAREFGYDTHTDTNTMPRDESGAFSSIEAVSDNLGQTQRSPQAYTTIEEFRASPDFNPVERMRWREKPYEENGATYHRLQFEMQDGTIHHGSLAVPTGPDAPIATHVAMTSWTTTPDDGMNKMEQGYFATDYGVRHLMVGPQQNITRYGRIGKAANNALEMAIFAGERFGFATDMLTTGDKSRGAMGGLAITSLARFHGVTIAYGDHVGSCLYKGIRSLGDVTAITRKLPNELRGVGEILTTRNPHELWKLKSSLDIRKLGAFQQLKEIYGLTNGEIGTIIDLYMPPDAFGYIDNDAGDSLALTEQWQQEITPERFENLILKIRSGGSHLGCVAARRSVDNRRDRLTTIFGIVGESGDELVQMGSRAGAWLRTEASQVNAVFKNGESLEPHEPEPLGMAA